MLGACTSAEPTGESGSATTATAGAGPGSCLPGEQLSFRRGRGLEWQRRPDVVILARGGDSRVKLTRAAVDYWNRQLGNIGSGFRLGNITVERLSFSIETYMPSVSRSVLRRRRGLPSGAPSGLERHCGRIVVVLAETQFVSFAKIVGGRGFLLVGIKGETHFPFDRPNVARNVIAHEIGHALGLRHNADPTKLMCGRPAPCRPMAFESMTPRFYPLADHEKRVLLDKYPGTWPGSNAAGS